jgi:Icc-related predicted phosphoesterase
VSRKIKILCVADEVDLLVYSSSIKERFGDVDLVLSAGDLPYEYLGFITSMLNKPLLSVAGNHDPDDRIPRSSLSPIDYDEITGSKNLGSLGRLSFSIGRESGVSVLGIPGSMRYNGGKNQYSDRAMAWRLYRLLPRLLFRKLLHGRAVDIILAHAPPRDIHDAEDPCHRGFSSFRWLIRLAAPVYFIHGHVHVYDLRELREFRFGTTTIVNVYGHRVLELGGENEG